MKANLFEEREIDLGDRVVIHVGIHSRCHEFWGIFGKRKGCAGYDIICKAVC